jgi:hypothetical protein
MSERRIEAVVVGPGAPGLVKVALGHGRTKFVVDVPFEIISPPLRLPNSQFVAVVEGRKVVRVEPDGGTWLTIQDRMRTVLNADWDPIGVADVVDDEYNGYIERIYSLLASDASEQSIAARLLSIEVELMGLEGTPMEHLLKVASELRILQSPSLGKS